MTPSMTVRTALGAMALSAAYFAPHGHPATGEDRLSAARDAEAAEHWAYLPPERPELPADPFGGWAENPIDLFVARGLLAAGLRPSPEADRVTLVRRATLDLTGLPPTPEEVDAFLADTAPGAYSRLLDRLLASPHYGEHQARAWLDQARYADSDGYEKDERRSIWRYRDWVIDAFNADLAFDRFTIEQLAGDLLDEPTTDQLVATGFHRNTMTNREGGVDPEEFRVAAVKDRAETTAAVWLGTTLECAQCHDHKFDPVSLGEYYRFYAFFDQTEDDGASNAPVIDAPRPEEEARRVELGLERAELEQRLATQTPELARDLARWEDAWRGVAGRWQPLRPTSAAGREGSRLAVLNDDSVLALGEPPHSDVYEVTADVPRGGFAALRLDVLTDPSLPEGGPGRPSHRNFVLSELEVFLVDPDGSEREVGLRSARADHEQTGSPPWPAAAAVDGEPTTGWAIAGGEGVAHQLVVELVEPLTVADGGTRLRFELHQLFGGGHLIGRLRLSLSAASPPALEPVPAPAVEPLLSSANAGGARDGARQSELEAWFRSRAPALDPVRARLVELEDEMRVPTTMILRERTERRVTRVQRRGNFLDPAREVRPGVPAALGALVPRRPAGEVPADRLDLARWLVSPENPLTARVAVNRVWERVFGRGLVETTNDFGTQGEAPSHPELLDWLALELQELGWSVKAFHRLLLTSSTYRQSSRVTPEHLAEDPLNVLLSRGPRVRVDAETVRDVALVASGLFCREVGGPSVFPPQPEGIWRMTYSEDRWATSEGCDRHRRGLYTFWRRTAPYPAFMLFDATSREITCLRRGRSNTPLQALALWNDPAFVELSGALARRMMVEAGPDAAARARRGFRLCVAREPELEELALLIDLYEEQRAVYASDPDRAARLSEGQVDDGGLDPVELAAWTVVANTLLNLDETITKG